MPGKAGGPALALIARANASSTAGFMAVSRAAATASAGALGLNSRIGRDTPPVVALSLERMSISNRLVRPHREGKRPGF
jgi:hypothetical protein